MAKTFATVVLMLSGAAVAVAQGNTEARTAYATVHGLKMYYRIQGTGRPLVLLHGALSNIDTDFGKLLPELAMHRQVIAVEQQAHGHTADIDRPLSYALMADDTAELLQQLNIGRADFLGYSMGGGIALELAMRHPELVGKLVWAGGANFSPDGLYTVIRDGAKDLRPELLAGTPWQRTYAEIAPDPTKWSALVFKIISPRSNREACGVKFLAYKRYEVTKRKIVCRVSVKCDPNLPSSQRNLRLKESNTRNIHDPA